VDLQREDHMRFSGTKYIVCFPAKWGNHNSKGELGCCGGLWKASMALWRPPGGRVIDNNMAYNVVYYCIIYYKPVRVGGGDSGGHVL
jgi:hypothetical protein